MDLHLTASELSILDPILHVLVSVFSLLLLFSVVSQFVLLGCCLLQFGFILDLSWGSVKPIGEVVYILAFFKYLKHFFENLGYLLQVGP